MIGAVSLSCFAVYGSKVCKLQKPAYLTFSRSASFMNQTQAQRWKNQ